MAYQHLEPFSRQVTIVVGLTVVGFMAFGLALSFYRNVLFEQTLGNLAAKNTVLKDQIDLGKRELEYYRSSQYKDKYAKENLGLVRPNEHVLVLAQNTKPALDTTESILGSIAEKQEAAYLDLLRQMPIIEHWKLYLFHQDRIEELRRSFDR